MPDRLIAFQVARVTQRNATTAIMCVGDTVLKESFNGMIRCCLTIDAPSLLPVYVKLGLLPSSSLPNSLLARLNCPLRVEDIRAAEADRVDVYKCFRPGDVVKAQVVSSATEPCVSRDQSVFCIDFTGRPSVLFPHHGQE